MRVIAGIAKGRRLKTVRGHAVRPTADRTKEALFSMLESRFALAGARVLDLFAGSGALGIEALSRGAAAAVFVEQDHSALRLLRENVDACGFGAHAHVRLAPVRRALADLAKSGDRFNGAFLDPPYGQDLLTATLQALGAGSLLTEDAWVVAERHVDDVVEEHYGRLRLTRTRRYGKTSVNLYCVVVAAEEPG